MLLLRWKLLLLLAFALLLPALLLLLSRGRTMRWRCCGCECCCCCGCGVCSGAACAVSALVASNLPKSSVGSSIFSEGRSSIGIKSSSSSLDKMVLSSSITGADFFCGLAITGFSATAGLFSFTFFSVSCVGVAFSAAGATTVFSATAFSSVGFTIGFAFSTSLFSAFSAILASLRGRPTLRLGAAFSAFGSATGASLALLAASSLGCC